MSASRVARLHHRSEAAVDLVEVHLRPPMERLARQTALDERRRSISMAIPEPAMVGRRDRATGGPSVVFGSAAEMARFAQTRKISFEARRT